MDKIKEIGLKIFNWSKKHKILSIILCLVLILYCLKGIVWFYNDINYGRFVKVEEIKKLKNTISYIKRDNDELLVFAPTVKNKKIINTVYLYKIKERKLENLDITVNAKNIKLLASIKNAIVFIKLDDMKLYVLNLFDKKAKKLSIENENISKKTEAKVIDKDIIAIISPVVIKGVFYYSIDILNFKNGKNKNALLKVNSKIQERPYIDVYDSGNGRLFVIDKIWHNHISIIDYKKLKLINEQFFGYRNDGLIYLGDNCFAILKKGVGEIHVSVYKINQDGSVLREDDFGIELGMNHKNIMFNSYAVNGNIIYFIGGIKEYTTHIEYSNNSFEFNLDRKTFTKITNMPKKIGKPNILLLDNKGLLLFGGQKSVLLNQYGKPNTDFYEFRISKRGK